MGALALAVLAVAPLTYPGIFQAHSGFLPVFNVTHPTDAPNWGRVPDLVRGEGGLSYLIAWPFWKLTSSGVTALCWSYGLAFVAAAAACYGWARRWLGRPGALLAATVYTYLPWHLSTVYVRGAYGEAWLWALWPLLLWAVSCLGDWRARPASPVALAPLAALASLVAIASLAASLWIQPGLTLLFVLMLPLEFGLRRGWRAGLVGLAALFLAVVAVALIPRPAASVPFGQHFLYPYQLLSAAWGYGTSVPGWQDGMSFQVGLVAVALGILALVAPGRSVDGGLRRAMRGWAAVLAVVLIATLGVTAPLWRVTRLEGLLTYPWQVLAIAGVPLAFLAGAAIRVEPRLAGKPALTALSALVILASALYLTPRFTQVDPGPEPVAVLRPVEAGSPQVLLLQDQVAPPGQITSTLVLTLTWQAVEPVEADYTVFVHLLAPDGSKVAQRDSRPCDGACPTNNWQPGTLVLDRHTLELGATPAPGPYRLAVGLYLLGSGERAAVMGRDDATVVLDVP